jgi:hypothetical protein
MLYSYKRVIMYQVDEGRCGSRQLGEIEDKNRCKTNTLRRVERGPAAGHCRSSACMHTRHRRLHGAHLPWISE